MTTKTTTTTKTWNLKSKSELRFEIQGGISTQRKLRIRLVDGFAELFGIEMMSNKIYEFSNLSNGAIFTYQGCQIETSSENVDLDDDLYVSSDTIMDDVLKIHGALQTLREEAVDMEEDGPRVAIVGPKNSGKSSIANILTAYAVRTGYEPIFVELDVAQGCAASTGSISAAQIDGGCLNIELGLELECPISYFFGHQDPEVNRLVYSKIVKYLTEHIDARIDSRESAKIKASGVIVNTCSCDGREGYDRLQSTLTTLNVTTVIVVGNEKLRSRLKKDMKTADIINVNRSPGVVSREKGDRIEISNNQLKKYFYGQSIQPCRKSTAC